MGSDKGKVRQTQLFIGNLGSDYKFPCLQKFDNFPNLPNINPFRITSHP